MSLPLQYPLMSHVPPFDTKLVDPTGPIAECWLPGASGLVQNVVPVGLSDSQLENSRKRFRAGADVHDLADADLHVPATDSGDDMIITDCELSGERPKRRMTTATGATGTNGTSVSSVTSITNGPHGIGEGIGTTVGYLTADSAHFPPIAAATNGATTTNSVHPCTPSLVDSPASPESPGSELNPHQLVLPLPLASPVQSVGVNIDGEGIKPHAQMAFEQQLMVQPPTTQAGLINMILGLSGHVLAQNRSHLVFSLLQRVPRLLLLAICDAVQRSLSHDILLALPLELALRVLLCLDVRLLLSVAQVSRRWHALTSNTALWSYMLKHDGLLSDDSSILRELADPRRLCAEWATPSKYLPPLNHAQLLYKKRHLIFRRWMDPQYEPRRVCIAGHGSNIVTCLQHDDEKVITGIEGKQINVHSTKTGRLERVLQGHDGGVWALKYFSNTLVSGSTDRDVRVWNIRTGRCTHVFRGHTSTVRCLDILHPVQIGVDDNGQPIIFPELPLLVTGSRDHNLHVWKLPLDNEQPNGDNITETKTFDSKDPANPYLVSILSGHTQSVRSVSGYGNIVISGSYDTTVRVWDLLKGGRCKHVLEGHSDKIYSTALNFNARRCFSGSMDLSINVWDFDKGKLLYSLEGHNLLVGLLELSDKYLVSAAADSTLRVWDPKTGENLSKLKGHNSAITCFQHDALRIVSGSERMLKLWDIQTGKFVRDLLSDITGSIWQVSFDADRCVAAVQTSKNGAEETFIEILDFSAPLNGTS